MTIEHMLLELMSTGVLLSAKATGGTRPMPHGIVLQEHLHAFVHGHLLFDA